MKSWKQLPSGLYLCDDDCISHTLGVCTCGLLHYISSQDDIDRSHYSHRFIARGRAVAVLREHSRTATWVGDCDHTKIENQDV